MYALFASLHITRQKFGALANLLDATLKNPRREGIDTNLDGLAELHFAEAWLGHINHHIQLVDFEQARDRRIGRQQIARPQIEHFNRRRARRAHFPFRQPRAGQGKLRLGLRDHRAQRRCLRCDSR